MIASVYDMISYYVDNMSLVIMIISALESTTVSRFSFLNQALHNEFIKIKKKYRLEITSFLLAGGGSSDHLQTT